MNLSILGYWAKLAQGPGFTACHKQLVCIARSVRKELIHVPSQALWGSVYSTVLYRTIGLSVQQDPCVLIKSKKSYIRFTHNKRCHFGVSSIQIYT